MAYKHVLVIDDDEDDLELFVNAIGEIFPDMLCTPFSDANTALSKMSSADIHADMVFLDLNMPGMNGYQFLKAMKETQSLNNIPVIVLSTTSNPSAIERTKDLGAKGFQTKPDNFPALREMLRGILN